MQQKVQLIASLVHDPELLILDEPFQGLDPVNVSTVKEIIRTLRAQGKTIVLSAHEMSLVEALCDRIALINRGKVVLYGELEAIKRQYSPNTVRVTTPSPLNGLPGVARTEHIENGTFSLTLDGQTDPQTLLRTLLECNILVESFEVAAMPLEEIFIRVVKESEHA